MLNLGLHDSLDGAEEAEIWRSVRNVAIIGQFSALPGPRSQLTWDPNVCLQPRPRPYSTLTLPGWLVSHILLAPFDPPKE